MIIVLKPGATQAEIDHVVERIEAAGFKPHLSRGVERTIIGVIGDDGACQPEPLESIPGVETGHADPEALQAGQPRVHARADHHRRPAA